MGASVAAPPWRMNSLAGVRPLRQPRDNTAAPNP
jgi:hypothetical protein